MIQLAGFAALYFLAAALWYAGAEGGLQGELARLIDARGGPPRAGNRHRRRPGADSDLGYPHAGDDCVWWILVVTANGMLAQSVLRRFDRNLRLPRHGRLRASARLAVAVGALLLLAFAPDPVGFLARTLAIIALVPFFFLGSPWCMRLPRAGRARRSCCWLSTCCLFCSRGP